jgi:hypothetical protein
MADINYQKLVSVEFNNTGSNYVPIVSIASNATIDANGFSVVRWYAQGGSTGIQTPGKVYYEVKGMSAL